MKTAKKGRKEGSPVQNFDQIYTAYYQVVFRYILTLTRDPDTAEEVTQQAFFQALKKIDRFRGDCALESWLCQIAKNTYLSMQRKNKRLSGESPADAAAAAETDVQSALEQQETADRLFTLLHQLPEPYKEVFWLRTFGERSFSEIAAIFGKTESWARVTYHRAKRKLQEGMESE